MNFFDLEFYLIFSVDLSNLIDKTDENALDALRGKRSWLVDISQMFWKNKHPVFENPEFDTSRYTKSARLEKFTISESYLNENSPLCFNVKKQMRLGPFVSSKHSVRLHQDGVLTVRFHFRQMKKHGRFSSFGVDEFVSTMQPIRKKIEEKAVDIISIFCDHWNKVSDNFALNATSKGALRNHLHKYEIILFDHGNNSAYRMPIKSMYSREQLNLLRQLVGFARMSRPFAWRTYSYEFMSEFIKSDIGNREDEFWLIYYERFVRYIPQRRDKSVILWLEDALLGIEILLAKKVALEYVTSWSRRELLLLRENIQFLVDRETFKPQQAIKEANRSIANLYSLLSNVLDPFSLGRSATHEFYLTLLKTVIKHLRIDDLARTAKSTFDDLYQTSQMIKALGDAEANLGLQEQMKKLTIIALLFTIASIIIAIFGLLPLIG